MNVFTQFLIICPLVFLGGFVDAIAGGGGLISLPAYLIAGLPVHMAIGTNKVSSAMGTTLTTVKFWRQGFISAKLALPCALFALGGSTLGANLALLVDDHIFKIILLFILPVTGFYVFRSKRIDNPVQEQQISRRMYIIASVCAFGIGIYDGFYGPGTGTFLLLLLTGLARMNLNIAAGTTKVINLSTNIAAMVTYLISGNVWLVLGLTAGLFGIAGNWLGARSFTRNGSRIVKPIIGVVLVIFFVRILWDLLGNASG